MSKPKFERQARMPSENNTIIEVWFCNKSECLNNLQKNNG